VAGDQNRLSHYIGPMRDAGIRVSLFIAADPAQIEAAARIGAPVIEIHSGAYTDFDSDGDIAARDAELARIVDGVKRGVDLGLEVHVGHGLNYDTVAPIAALPEVRELNIGHFLMGEAIFTGLENTIKRMRAAMDDARADAHGRPGQDQAKAGA